LRTREDLLGNIRARATTLLYVIYTKLRRRFYRCIDALLALSLSADGTAQGLPWLMHPPTNNTLCVKGVSALRRTARVIHLDGAEAHYAHGLSKSPRHWKALLDHLRSDRLVSHWWLGQAPLSKAPSSTTKAHSVRQEQHGPKGTTQRSNNNKDKSIIGILILNGAVAAAGRVM